MSYVRTTLAAVAFVVGVFLALPWVIVGGHYVATHIPYGYFDYLDWVHGFYK
jgi:hypothetical protein